MEIGVGPLGNTYIRPMTGNGVPVGWIMQGHTHNFDHVSIMIVGRWKISRWRPAVNIDGEPLFMPDGQEAWVKFEDYEQDAPFFIHIEAGCRHEFVYLGAPIPAWMERFLILLPKDKISEFRAEYAKTLGLAWCVYSHRTPQGDVVEYHTGWEGAYQ